MPWPHALLSPYLFPTPKPSTRQKKSESRQPRCCWPASSPSWSSTCQGRERGRSQAGRQACMSQSASQRRHTTQAVVSGCGCSPGRPPRPGQPPALPAAAPAARPRCRRRCPPPATDEQPPRHPSIHPRTTLRQSGCPSLPPHFTCVTSADDVTALALASSSSSSPSCMQHAATASSRGLEDADGG